MRRRRVRRFLLWLLPARRVRVSTATAKPAGEAGSPTVWDIAWREGHAHGLANGLGISYREGYLRTVAMLRGDPLPEDEQ